MRHMGPVDWSAPGQAASQGVPRAYTIMSLNLSYDQGPLGSGQDDPVDPGKGARSKGSKEGNAPKNGKRSSEWVFIYVR